MIFCSLVSSTTKIFSLCYPELTILNKQTVISIIIEYFHHPLDIIKILLSDITHSPLALTSGDSVGEGVEQLETSCIAGGNVNWYNKFLKLAVCKVYNPFYDLRYKINIMFISIPKYRHSNFRVTPFIIAPDVYM